MRPSTVFVFLKNNLVPLRGGAAQAAAEEADDRIGAVEQRLVQERVARNKAAAEFARVAAERGGAGGGDAMTSLLLLSEPPRDAAAHHETTTTTTTTTTTATAMTTAASTTNANAITAAVSSSAAMTAVREADALALLKASSSPAAELKLLRDKLERTANDYDRVKRSLAWSEEIRKAGRCKLELVMTHGLKGPWFQKLKKICIN